MPAVSESKWKEESVIAMIAGAVTVLLRAKPYIEVLLEALALAPAPQPGGNATTCPG